jgi:hypothetical protein
MHQDPTPSNTTSLSGYVAPVLSNSLLLGVTYIIMLSLLGTMHDHFNIRIMRGTDSILIYRGAFVLFLLYSRRIFPFKSSKIKGKISSFIHVMLFEIFALTH